MKKEMKNKIAEFAPQMYSVLKELQESASYWSEYDVPIGIVDRINDVFVCLYCYKPLVAVVEFSSRVNL